MILIFIYIYIYIYIYIRIRLGLVIWFQGISTLDGYLMPNLVYTCIYIIYMIILMIYKYDTYDL